MDTPFFNMLVQIFLDDYNIDHVISKLTTKLKTKKVKPQTLCFGDLVLNIRIYLERTIQKGPFNCLGSRPIVLEKRFKEQVISKSESKLRYYVHRI